MEKLTKAHLPGSAAIRSYQNISLGRRGLSGKANSSQQYPEYEPKPRILDDRPNWIVAQVDQLDPAKKEQDTGQDS